jgi:hypothetical protein
MKTFFIFIFASIGLLTEVPEVCAGCVVFVVLLLAVKPSK